jgi:hypothetical protein
MAFNMGDTIKSQLSTQQNSLNSQHVSLCFTSLSMVLKRSLSCYVVDNGMQLSIKRTIYSYINFFFVLGGEGDLTII